MKKCPQCAEEIKDEAMKCKHCGSQLDSTSKKDSLERHKSNSLIGWIFGILMLMSFFGMLSVGLTSGETGAVIIGLGYLVAALISIPYTYNFWLEKTGLTISAAGKFLLALILIVGTPALGVSYFEASPDTSRQQAGEQATTSASKATGSADTNEETKPEEKPVALNITDKGFVDGTFQQQVTMKFEFQNNTDKDVRGVQGTLKLFDIFGDRITEVGLSYDEGIPAGQQQTYEAGTDFNQFSDSDVKLKETKLENLEFEWEIDSVIYADGSEEEI
jgi:hypothetical protein